MPSAPIEDKKIQAALSRYRQNLDRYEGIDLSLRKSYKNILLTGATGTLGIYLLQGLLEKTEAKIILIVRGRSDAHCLQRVQQHFSYTFGKELDIARLNRLQILGGNLSDPQLGLSGRVYGDLAGRVDCIIHSAANTRHAGEYQEFYRANVVSTEQLVALLETKKKQGKLPLYFHHFRWSRKGFRTQCGVFSGKRIGYWSAVR